MRTFLAFLLFILQFNYSYSQSISKELNQHLVDVTNQTGIKTVATDLASKQIIALAENSHGTKEFSIIRYTLLKELIQTTSLKNIGFEEDYGDIQLFNQNINGKIDSYKEHIQRLGLPFHNQEFIDFIEWLKNHNDHATEKVQIYGLDMQYNRGSAYVLLQELSNLEDTIPPAHLDLLNTLKNNHYTGYIKTLDNIEKDKILLDLQELKSHLDKSVQSFNEPARKIAVTLAIDALIQKVTAKNTSKQMELRNHFMFKNLQTILSYQNQKFALITHSRHAQKEDLKVFAPLGYYLKQKYKENYFVVGFEFGQGLARASKDQKHKDGIYKIKANDSFTSQLMKKGKPDEFYINFNILEETSNLKKELNKECTFKNIGGVIRPGAYIFLNPLNIYDAVIFVKESTPTTKI